MAGRVRTPSTICARSFASVRCLSSLASPCHRLPSRCHRVQHHPVTLTSANGCARASRPIRLCPRPPCSCLCRRARISVHLHAVLGAGLRSRSRVGWQCVACTSSRIPVGAGRAGRGRHRRSWLSSHHLSRRRARAGSSPRRGRGPPWLEGCERPSLDCPTPGGVLQ